MATLGSLGELVLALSADTAIFEKDLGRANAKAVAFGAAVGTVIGQGVSAAIRFLSDLTKKAIDAGDQYDKMAQKVAMPAEELSILAAQAQIADVPISALSASLQRLQVNAAAVAAGKGGKASEAFRAMGIDVKQFGGNTKTAFDTIMMRLGQYDDSMEKSALFTAIFGASGQHLQPLANEFAKTKALAEELGLVMDSQTAAAAGRFKDNLKAAELATGAIGTRIAAVLLPTLEKLSGFLVESAKNTERLDNVTRIADTGLKLFATAGTAVAAVFDTLGGVIGAVARGLTFAAKGEYHNAFRAVREGGFDMAEKVTTAVKRVGAIWDETATEVAAKAPQTSDKLAAPALLANEKIGKSLEEITKKLQSESDAQARIWAQLHAGRISFIEDDPHIKSSLEGQSQMWGLVGESTEQATKKAKEFNFTFDSAMEDAILEGRELSDVVQALEKDISRMILRMTVTEPLGDAMRGAVKIGMGELFGPVVPDSGMAFEAVPRAGGGPVSRGMPYLVGEQGPELMIPDASGTIIPNGGVGVGGVTIIQHINIDSRSDRASIAMAMSASKEQAKAELRAELERGGSFSRSVGKI